MPPGRKMGHETKKPTLALIEVFSRRCPRQSHLLFPLCSFQVDNCAWWKHVRVGASRDAQHGKGAPRARSAKAPLLLLLTPAQ